MIVDTSSYDQVAKQHLRLRVRALLRPLAKLIDGQTDHAEQLDRPEMRGFCVTQQEVNASLLRIMESLNSDAFPDFQLSAEDKAAEIRLRELVADEPESLPLDMLRQSLGFSEFEIHALVACAAVELDRQFEKLIGYVHDDLNCRQPSVELLCRWIGGAPLRYRPVLGPSGKLRTSGLLMSFGEQTTEARSQLRLGPGVFEFLLGECPSLCGIWKRESGSPPTLRSIDPRCLRISEMIRTKKVGIIGLWGADSRATAMACGKTLVEVPFEQTDLHEAILKALRQAAVQRATLLVNTDRLLQVTSREIAEQALWPLGNCEVPCIFHGRTPWRPTALLAQRVYLEINLPPVDPTLGATRWQAILPEMQFEQALAQATRFGFLEHEIRAATGLAQATAAFHSNGKTVSWRSHLDEACLAIATRNPAQFAAPVDKKRGPDDLVLPPDLHRQILEIASFARALPAVANEWGFGRLASGQLGIKCLFAGDPGTGKTLAAEVIGTMIGAPLLKINLAQTVSKWVGETEKNVDAAFEEAAASRAILFFDEADALFGKRGDVKQGVDRYANLEVSHLLQRLEDHAGVVILASNLKDNIDPAFIRRFQSVLHFPRPTETERIKLWTLAFPKEAPLTSRFQPDMFANLDLTGAGIVNAARTAALLAASDGASEIGLAHIIQGITRQFRQDGRTISPHQLGEHAHLLMEL